MKAPYGHFLLRRFDFKNDEFAGIEFQQPFHDPGPDVSSAHGGIHRQELHIDHAGIQPVKHESHHFALIVQHHLAPGTTVGKRLLLCGKAAPFMRRKTLFVQSPYLFAHRAGSILEIHYPHLVSSLSLPQR